jgi:predicted nucleotidyltransferase
VSANIPLDREKIADFCQRWKITELALFGSVLRDDFRSDSDVDVLVTFAPDAEWSLFDHLVMEEELSALLGRKVDLVSRRAIERSTNWIRRKAILETAEPFYSRKMTQPSWIS